MGCNNIRKMMGGLAAAVPTKKIFYTIFACFAALTIYCKVEKEKIETDSLSLSLTHTDTHTHSTFENKS